MTKGLLIVNREDLVEPAKTAFPDWVVYCNDEISEVVIFVVEPAVTSGDAPGATRGARGENGSARRYEISEGGLGGA